jgi:hypothetical protein
MGWMARVQFLAGARLFSLLYSIWISSGAHPVLIQWVLGVKQLGCEADHPHPSVKTKNGGARPPFNIHCNGMVLN